MATTTTYDVVGNREDLTNALVNLSRTDTYLFSHLRRDRAYARRHDWQTEALAAASAANAVIEGAVVTFAAETARTLKSNWCQIMDKKVSVSDTQRVTRTAGIPEGDEYLHAVEKKMKELARDAESALLLAASASGSAGVARSMDGFQSIITTNSSTSAGARNYSRAVHNTLLQTVYTNGGNPTVMIVKPSVRVHIADFPASAGGGSGSVIQTQPAGGEFVDTFERYRDPFGSRLIVSSIFLSTATASAGVIMVMEEICAISFLQQVQHRETARVGHSTDGMIWLEATLEYGNELGHAEVLQLN